MLPETSTRSLKCFGFSDGFPNSGWSSALRRYIFFSPVRPSMIFVSSKSPNVWCLTHCRSLLFACRLLKITLSVWTWMKCNISQINIHHQMLKFLLYVFLNAWRKLLVKFCVDRIHTYLFQALLISFFTYFSGCSLNLFWNRCFIFVRNLQSSICNDITKKYTLKISTWWTLCPASSR